MDKSQGELTPGVYSLAWLALAVGVLPFVVVHISFAVSGISGYVPLCNPYLDGCASISASGRHGFSYFFFKFGMILAAVLLAAFWVVCGQWLRLLGDRLTIMQWVMVFTGCTSAVFLVLYTVYLGSRGDFYQFMRRTGVTFYFSFSYLAQLLMLARLQRLQRHHLITLPAYILRSKTIIVSALLVFGLASIPVTNLMMDKAMMEKDRMENIIEWFFSLLMISYYFFTWLAWRQTGLSLSNKPLAITLNS